MPSPRGWPQQSATQLNPENYRALHAVCNQTQPRGWTIVCLAISLALFFFVSARPVSAQSATDGAIGGQVVSASGRPIAGCW